MVNYESNNKIIIKSLTFRDRKVEGLKDAWRTKEKHEKRKNGVMGGNRKERKQTHQKKGLNEETKKKAEQIEKH